MVIDEAAVPEHLLAAERAPPQPAGIAERAQRGRRNHRRCPLQSRTGFEREDTVMGFSAKQVKALRRNLDHRSHPHTRGQWARTLLHRGLVCDLRSQPDLWL